jgi:8-oxo-dGTP pyrophosphatase MutT (NUDIX family)
VSTDPPFGALIVVYRRILERIEYLVLHRAHNGPEYEGDWAWGPPGGSRDPGETIDDCARRELHEETGLELTLRRVHHDPLDWAVYLTEAPAGTGIALSSEHDRWLWLPARAALAQVSPTIVTSELRSAIRDLEDDI